MENNTWKVFKSPYSASLKIGINNFHIRAIGYVGNISQEKIYPLQERIILITDDEVETHNQEVEVEIIKILFMEICDHEDKLVILL